MQEYAATLESPLKEPLEPMSAGSFGENLHLDGGDSFHSGSVCVGDEFTFLRDGKAVLQVQVASPRRPCSHVDMAFHADGPFPERDVTFRVGGTERSPRLC